MILSKHKVPDGIRSSKIRQFLGAGEEERLIQGEITVRVVGWW
jgi:hypothetical protein